MTDPWQQHHGGRICAEHVDAPSSEQTPGTEGPCYQGPPLACEQWRGAVPQETQSDFLTTGPCSEQQGPLPERTCAESGEGAWPQTIECSPAWQRRCLRPRPRAVTGPPLQRPVQGASDAVPPAPVPAVTGAVGVPLAVCCGPSLPAACPPAPRPLQLGHQCRPAAPLCVGAGGPDGERTLPPQGTGDAVHPSGHPWGEDDDVCCGGEEVTGKGTGSGGTGSPHHFSLGGEHHWPPRTGWERVVQTGWTRTRPSQGGWVPTGAAVSHTCPPRHRPSTEQQFPPAWRPQD